MAALPHGWKMRNSTVDISGPPREQDDGSESGTESLDIKPDSEGWEDVEDDSEALAIQCLLCNDNFPTANAMLEHCKTSHEFDFLKTKREQGLDFYTTIKFVNYIRSETLAGKAMPDVTNPSLWADDRFLQPALDDDALLFSLDDIDDVTENEEEDAK